MKNKTIGVIGLGLIGGSIAKDLKEHAGQIIGHDRSESHLQVALEIGLVERAVSVEELVRSSDIVIIAVPVLSAIDVTREILDSVSSQQVVIDTGSTKASICKALATHERRGRFVPCHPLAGTEFSGPTAAISDLFKNKKNIICDEQLCDDDALSVAIDVMNAIGMQNLFMSSDMHDKHMAYVSHLSHVSSFTLGSTVLDIEQDEKQIFNLASTGFASTVRLAKSSPVTWTDIFLDNEKNVLTALDSYIEHLETVKSLVSAQDRDGLLDYLSKSNEIKRTLNGMKYNIVKIS